MNPSSRLILLAALVAMPCVAPAAPPVPTPAVAAPVATAPAQAASASEGTAALQARIPNFKQPRDHLLTGGQPEAGAWSIAAQTGVRTVINLRPQAELGARDEATEVAAAGLRYYPLPIAGAGDVTVEHARELWSQLQQAEGEGDVLLHCASSNRVGALLAIGAAVEGGMDTEAAIAFGRSAGLGSLEPRVREVLATPAD